MSEMQAGREIDALIAEKVMGWKVHARNTAWWVKAEEENESTTNIMGWTCGNDRFSPSTDIAAAWEVREHMKKSGFYGLIKDCGKSYTSLFVKTMVDEEGEHEQIGHSLAETAPLVICRAALKALGVS